MPASRGIVYTLLTVVVVLLLGIIALLGVAYQRHQRLADETTDLRRSLYQQNTQISALQKRLEDCDTVKAVSPVDTSWAAVPAVDSIRAIGQVTTGRK